MSNHNNINFESFTNSDKFRSTDGINKKIFIKLVNRVRESIDTKKNVFHSFSKKFKLSFNFNELKKFKKFKRIIIIGLGGSILGAQSINYFLNKNSKKNLIFMNNLDLYQIDRLRKLKGLKKSLFIIISKSGSTVEVLSIINSLKDKAKFNNNNSIVITENKKNNLYLFAKKLKLKIIFHKNYIGGRYSIFSETALVPCYLMGFNVLKLKKNILNFLNKKKNVLINNLLNLSKVYESKKFHSLVLLNYVNGLDYFLMWCQQLIAESLGKKGKGIIPLISIAPRDHHSLLQLYLDGPRDNFFYIFSSKESKKKRKIKGLFSEALNNASAYELINNQKKAMISLLKDKKIPFISIEIQKRDEETLGELFSYFILETVLIAESLKINPFNQPAVEQLKVLTNKNLFKKIQR